MHPQLSAVAEEIEKLAAQFVTQRSVADAPDAWLESLMGLSRLAHGCGQEEIASVATAMAESISSGRGDVDRIVGTGISLMQDSLGSLSESLESELRTEAVHEPEPVSPAVQPGPPTALAQDPELIADFVLESREHLDSIESQLLAFEQSAGSTEPVNAIFRSFHTIKGLAGFLEFAVIQEVAHEVETVLDRARQGELRITENAIDVILASRDFIGQWLTAIEAGPMPVVPPHLARPAGLLSRIKSLTASGAGELAATEQPQPAQSRTQDESAAIPEQSRRTGPRSIKVDTERLDYLVDMVGEMVIAQSLVRHDPDLSESSNPGLLRNLGQLARITDEIQRTAMALRMVPVGPLFQKMTRLGRDLSRKSGKKIQVECEGENVELDRNIVEQLADPLMHMVRNAADHGIETPEQRKAAGKPETARLGLRAFHRSGQIVIEVSDDGRGINRRRILEKARERGLVAQNASLSDTEVLNLIFHPGFSTAEKISDISGRGVGMDVVRKQIQRLRGSVEISSQEGTGTVFSLKLPLTLAIIDALVVAVGKERYIVPIGSVREMLRPGAGMVSKIENRAEVVLIREKLLPLVRLYHKFGIQPRTTNPADAVLVVVEVEGASFCLMVDELVGKQEVVIKGLGPVFQHVAGVAGGAILGDGQIGLILDMKGIFGGRVDV